MKNNKNILFITSDQQHWFTLGFMNPEVKTPNLDRLATHGTNFTRAYTVNPTCTPTRASWITGTYPSQHGAYSLGTKLMENVHVAGDDFRKAGYKTALIGKAHFQPLKETEEYSSLESYPTLQDLDFWRTFKETFYGFEDVELARNHADEAHVGQHYALWLEERGCANWKDYFRPPTGIRYSESHTWEIPEKFHYGTWIAESCNARLEEYAKNDDNFYLWASFFDPHPAYLVPEPWDKYYDPESLTIPEISPGEHANNPPHFKKTQEENPDFSEYYDDKGGNVCHGFFSHLHDKNKLAKDIAIYYGMISLMDQQIGRILDKLDDLGLREETLVVFTTDHGHFYGHHGLTAKGAFHYEDMIKVPLIASLPGVIPQGHSSDHLQSMVDMAPTFLSAAGISIPACMTGLDMMQEWSGKQSAIRDHVICENRHQPTKVHVKTYVERRYKLTVYYGEDYGELFDLESDPSEVNNLWSDPNYSDLKSNLTMRMLMAEMGKEAMPMPRIAPA